MFYLSQLAQEKTEYRYSFILLLRALRQPEPSIPCSLLKNKKRIAYGKACSGCCISLEEEIVHDLLSICVKVWNTNESDTDKQSLLWKHTCMIEGFWNLLIRLLFEFSLTIIIAFRFKSLIHGRRYSLWLLFWRQWSVLCVQSTSRSRTKLLCVPRRDFAQSSEVFADMFLLPPVPTTQMKVRVEYILLCSKDKKKKRWILLPCWRIPRMFTLIFHVHWSLCYV